MAYRKVDMIELKEILIRVADGQSKRGIRKVMGIHGITLNRYLGIAKELGVDIEELTRDRITDELVASIKNKLTTAPSSLIIPRDKLLLPHKDEIEGYLKKSVSRSKIVRILGREGVQVSKSSLHRFIKSKLGSYVNEGITVRLPETEPGQYAQADFGKLGKLWDVATKRERTAWAFIVTLVFSRHMHVYVTFSQDSAALIEGCEAAWAYFGGISLILIVDNMSPSVDIPDKYSPKINKLFLEYAQARGFMIDPANIGHAKGKPHVERMVPYIRNDFFGGENFISLDDCQERAVDWCSHIAGARIHQTTRKIPIEVFEEIEKDKLISYDYNRYDTPYWGLCKVHPDHHISFKKSLYSVPTIYIGKKVEVRGDSALVRIYYKDRLIKTHKRLEEGKRATDFSDYPPELTPYTLRNPAYQIQEGKKRHPLIGEYIEFMLSGTYPWHRLRSVQKLLRIADKYGADRTAAACRKAKAYDIYDIRRIENILRKDLEDFNTIPEAPALFEGQARFLRDADYFKNYNELRKE